MSHNLLINCVAGAGLTIGKEAPATSGARIDCFCNSLRQMILQPSRVFAPDGDSEPATRRVVDIKRSCLAFDAYPDVSQ